MTEITVREHPILFSGPMIRAILEGRKTQTRRVVKDRRVRVDPVAHDDPGHVGGAEWRFGSSLRGIPGRSSSPVTFIRCPYGQPGDRLWVREAHQLSPDGPVYRATAHEHGTYDFGGDGPWRPSIHMPRWASRITLEVTDVRVERVQEISYEDVEAEGVDIGAGWGWVKDWADLWDSINAGRGYSWKSNPWVWVISFKPVDA